MENGQDSAVQLLNGFGPSWLEPRWGWGVQSMRLHNANRPRSGQCSKQCESGPRGDMKYGSVVGVFSEAVTNPTGSATRTFNLARSSFARYPVYAGLEGIPHRKQSACLPGAEIVKNQFPGWVGGVRMASGLSVDGRRPKSMGGRSREINDAELRGEV